MSSQLPLDPYGVGIPRPDYGSGAPSGYPGYPGYPGYMTAARPGTIPLRPLKLGDLLEGIFATLRRNPGAVFGISILVSVIQAGLYALASFWFFRALQDFFTLTESQAVVTDDMVWDILRTSLFGAGALYVLSIVSSVFFSLLAQGALAIPVLRSAIGLKTSFGLTLRLLGGAWSRLLGLALLVTAVLTLVAVAFLTLMSYGFISFLEQDFSRAGQLFLLVIPASFVFGIISIWITVRLCVAPAAIAVEQRGMFAGLKRSWSLTQGNWWRTLGIMLLVSLIVSIAVSVVTTPLSLLLNVFVDPTAPYDENAVPIIVVIAIQVGISLFLTMIGQCLLCIMFGLFYVDYRTRREGFNHELASLATEAGQNVDQRFQVNHSARAHNMDTDRWVPGRASQTR